VAANTSESNSTRTTTYDSRTLTEAAPFWHSLEGPGCSPIQQYLWSEACWNTLPCDGELHIVAVKNGPRSGAIAPLVKRSALGRLEHLGVKYLHEPADFLYSDEAALKRLVSVLAESGAPLFLERIPSDSATVAAIQSSYNGRAKIIVREAPAFPRIALTEDWAEPESQLNSGRRSDLRRAIRNAEKIGTIRYEILTPKPSELGTLLDEALEVEASNWKGREGSAVAKDALRGKFYRQYASAACESGVLRLAFLRLGGRAVAMQYAIQAGGSYWLLKIGYRDEVARCSPGMLLIAETIRYASAQGLASYEFLGTAASWTRIWAKEERGSVALRVYPAGVRGYAALGIDAARVGRRRLVEKLKSRKTKSEEAPAEKPQAEKAQTEK
jgi:CelD/BcsL family acetyltransferase involved in cellulose biosynthesis